MKWFTASRASAVLLALVLIVGGGNLWATHASVHSAQVTQQREQAAQLAQRRREHAAQRKAAEAVERKICTTMHRLAALQPPAGNPRTNPSRAFDDELHTTLDQLGPDLGCP